MSKEKIYHKFVFVSEFLQRTKNNVGNISRGQGRILAILKRKDGLTTKELSEILNINVSSTNELLAKLEKKEYITKEQLPEDKRIRLIKLTEKGFRYQLKAPDSIWVFDCLKDDEKEKFEEYLDDIIDNIHEKLKKQDPEKFQEKAEKRKLLFEKHFGENHENTEWYKIINKY